MDFILDSPLNKAHFYSRKADRLEERGKFDEACQYHEQAATCLVDALSLSGNQLAVDSIQLQSEYHIKKQELLRIKKKQIEAIQEAVRAQQELMSRVMKAKKSSSESDGDGSLQKAIIRTFDEADSLLEKLVQKKDKDKAEEKQQVTSETSLITAGSKKPKDDSVVIEELKIVNYQLRSLINQLMVELSNSERQVVQLKKRILELEATSTGVIDTDHFKAAGDTLADDCSRKTTADKLQDDTMALMNPAETSGLSDDVDISPATSALDDLTDLPPLEMPQF